MKLENLVCTYEQAVKLKKLGITGPAAFIYEVALHNKEKKRDIVPFSVYHYDRYDTGVKYNWDTKEDLFAFTMAEICVMLPHSFETPNKWGLAQNLGFRQRNDGLWFCFYDPSLKSYEDNQFMVTTDCYNLTVGATNLLIYLLERKLTTPEVCNENLIRGNNDSKWKTDTSNDDYGPVWINEGMPEKEEK